MRLPRLAPGKPRPVWAWGNSRLSGKDEPTVNTHAINSDDAQQFPCVFIISCEMPQGISNAERLRLSAALQDALGAYVVKRDGACDAYFNAVWDKRHRKVIL